MALSYCIYLFNSRLLQIYSIFQEFKELFIFLTFPYHTRRKLVIIETVTQGLSLIVHLSGFLRPVNIYIYYTHLKSLVVPVIWLALIGVIYSRIAPFFALNRVSFPANEEATLKTKQPIRFQGLFKATNQIVGKRKTKSITWKMLQILFPELLFTSPPPKKKQKQKQKMDEFNCKPAQYYINKIFELTTSCIWAISKWM